MLQPLPDRPDKREADDQPSAPSVSPTPKSPASVWLPADWLETLVEAEASTPTAEVIDIQPGARWLPPEVPVQWTPPAAQTPVPELPSAPSGPVASLPTPMARTEPVPAPAPPVPAVIEDVRVIDVQLQARRIARSLPTISAGGLGRYARAHRNQILVTAAAVLALALPVFSSTGSGGLTGQPGATAPTPPAHASLPPAGSPPVAPVVAHHGGGASATHAGARLHVPAAARVAATPVVHSANSTAPPSLPAPTAPKSSGGGGGSSSGSSRSSGSSGNSGSSGSHGSNSGGGSHPTPQPSDGGEGSPSTGSGNGGSGSGGGSQSPVSSVVGTVSNAPATLSSTVKSAIHP